jgi:phage-related minor tail protein
MADPVDELVVELRADGSALRREVAALKSELEGPLGAGAARAGAAIESALLRAVRSGKLGFDDLKRVALSALAEIARSALAQGLGALGGIGGGGGPGGALGGVLSALATSLIGAPGRATGGAVSAGRTYLVGERGPELFVPTSSGRIEAGLSRSARGPVTIHVHVSGGASEPQRFAQSGRQVARAVRRALADLED